MEVPSNEALGNRQQAKATKSSLAAVIHWERLPSIVQQAVLMELSKDYNRHSLEDKRCRAAYAAVNLQWQEFFEKLHFNKLVLRNSDLRSFGKIVTRRSHRRKRETGGWQKQRITAEASPTLCRMPQIRHIWLRIGLLAYDCRRCKLPEEPKEAVRYVD